MAKFAYILALLTANIVVASVIPRQAPGTQFITGPCKVDADCASGCCGFNSGKCAGAIIALTRDGGCGHGEATNSRAAAVLRGNCPGTTLRREIIEEIEARAPLSPDPAGAKNVGNGKGGQFITGQCTSNADCGSGCCATLGNIGICSGPGAADQQGKTGCGFNGGGGGAAPPPPPPPPANNGGAGGSAGSGKPPGTQFITGPCANDGECASGCCGFKSGKCAGAIIAQERDGGCGFGNPTPNDDAARKLRGQAPASPPPPPPAQAPPPPPPVNNGGAAPPAAGGPATAGQTAIGGACAKDSDCTTACCGFTSGKCALAKTAPGSDGGCGKGEAAPNTKAASVIAGNAPIC